MLHSKGFVIATECQSVESTYISKKFRPWALIWIYPAARVGQSQRDKRGVPPDPTFSYSVIHTGSRPSSWTSLSSFKSRSYPG